jgi:type II secretion system protein L
MSIQLSLYWQSVDQLEWYWSGDTDVYSGSFEELQDQKRKRNLDSCSTRLFLPAFWFSTIEVQLPANARRITPQMLKFAAEEYLAQDIDSVHLVLRHKPQQGLATVQVTDVERLKQIFSTLKGRHFEVNQAYNAQIFTLNDNPTEDVLIQVVGQNATVTSDEKIYNVHTQGFSGWFDIWSKQTNLPEDASILLISDVAEGPAKRIVAEFEATGHELQWTVREEKRLIDWHEASEHQRISGNLMTGPFSQSSGSAKASLWLPSLVAVLAFLILWSTYSILSNIRDASKVEQVWKASELVFLQVFGQDKRIQRPLMVREMRSRASAGGDDAQSTPVNALVFLRDINESSSTFVLEDFRFNKARNEAFFTLAQPVAASGDAFNLFEALKDSLAAKNYDVEYSANQDNDSYRAQFKAVYGGQS